MHCGFVDSSLSCIRYLGISDAHVHFYIDCSERATPDIFTRFWETHFTVDLFFREYSGRIIIFTKPFLFNAKLYTHTIIHTHCYWSLMKWYLFRIVFPVVTISCNIPLSPSSMTIGLHLWLLDLQSKIFTSLIYALTNWANMYTYMPNKLHH